MAGGGAPLSLTQWGRCGRQLAAGLAHLPGCCGVARGWGCTASWLSPTNWTPEQVLCNCGHAQPVCTAPWAWVCARALAGRAGLGCASHPARTWNNVMAVVIVWAAPVLALQRARNPGLRRCCKRISVLGQLRCCGAWGSAYVAVQEWRSLPPCRRCGKLWPCSDM